ncbi:MAG: ChbG/HpnK family deacetylase [Xanthobacteraceae bacterium]|nr:ChbG/HpnK family deacetylase [Xanthobacteraceae bacterium]
METASAAPAPAPRKIWLCADDYGISPGVSGAIRDLIGKGRINATSVMVVAPSFHRSEAITLNALRVHGARAAIGLHLTLSAPFQPLTDGFKPLVNKAFPAVGSMLVRALLGQLDRKALQAEIAAQIRMFGYEFGRAPDFIDGHQHAHIFPQVRDVLFKLAREMAPNAWIRQCGGVGGVATRIGDPKGLVLDLLSKRFRERAAAMDVRTNPAFAGTYSFKESVDFAALFPRFLEHLPDGGLVMCHPGVVDAELRRLDPLTTLREKEYAYFSGEAFPKLLADKDITLA